MDRPAASDVTGNTSMVKVLGVGGAELIGEVDSYYFGSFGWFVDPDGNKVELWEPRFPERAADD